MVLDPERVLANEVALELFYDRVNGLVVSPGSRLPQSGDAVVSRDPHVVRIGCEDRFDIAILNPSLLFCSSRKPSGGLWHLYCGVEPARAEWYALSSTGADRVMVSIAV